MRDRKRLITLIRTHQHLLDPVRFKYNPKFEEYIPVKQKLHCVIRYLERKKILYAFATSVSCSPEEILAKVEKLEYSEVNEIEEESKEVIQEVSILPPIKGAIEFQNQQDKDPNAEAKIVLLDQLFNFLDSKTASSARTHKAQNTPEMEQVIEEVPEEQEADENYAAEWGILKFDKIDERFKRMQRKDAIQSSLLTSEDSKEESKSMAAFEFDGKVVYRVHKSLDYFTKDNCLRKFLVRIVENEKFNTAIMIIIVLNACTIVMYSNLQQDLKMNKVISEIQIVFTAIYVLEAIAKIIASGLFIGKNTYLRSYANIFDFIIVLVSLLQVFFEFYLKKEKQAIFVFRVLRVFRLGRILSSFYKIPQLQQQLRTLGKAMEGMMSVLLFLCTFFIFLSLIGLQLFGDDIYNACRLTPIPIVENGKIVWPRAPIESLSPGGICNKSNLKAGGFHCPPEYTCGNFLEYNLPLQDDQVQLSPQLYFDVFIWKHFGGSLLSILQIVTADTWGNHMYNLINASNFFLPVVFCFLTHMIGTYYLMNLMLVIIIESYIKSKEDYSETDIEASKSSIKKFQKEIIEKEKYANQRLQADEYLESPEFEKDMKEFMDSSSDDWSDGTSMDSENETHAAATATNTQAALLYENQSEIVQLNACPLKKQASIHEPEIEDGLRLQIDLDASIKQEALNQDSQGQGFADNSPSKHSEHELSEEEDSMPITRNVIKTLKKLNDIRDQLTNKENKKAFTEFMAKAAVLAQFEDITKAKLADELSEMEYSLLLLKFENAFRQTYNDEKFVKYGLKKEKQVLNIIDKSCSGMFNKFLSQSLRHKDKKQLVLQIKAETPQIETKKTRFGQSESSFSISKKSKRGPGKEIYFSPIRADSTVNSFFRQQNKREEDEIRIIKTKLKLELRDGVILSLDRMHHIIHELQTEQTPENHQSQLCARDYIILTQAVDTFEGEKAEQILKLRAGKVPLYQVCLFIDAQPTFQALISLTIVANFIVLALDRHPSNPVQADMKERANIVFYFVFLFEMVIKMLGNGMMIYFENSFNKFDFVVIFISTIEILINFINFGNVSLSAIRALRVFRLLRMFKLAKTWKSFNELLNLLALTFNKVVYLTCILLLFWMTFAILGKQLFSQKLSFDEDHRPVSNEVGYAPNFNFDSFGQSFISVFVFFTSDGWSRVLQDYFRIPGLSNVLAIFFFFMLLLFGNLVIVNLFRAIIIREFDQQSLLKSVEFHFKTENNNGLSIQQSVKAFCAKLCCRKSEQVKEEKGAIPLDVKPQNNKNKSQRRKPTDSQNNNSVDGNKVRSGKAVIDPKDRALFIFGQDNAIRKICKDTENFEYRGYNLLNAVIYIAIGITSLMPCFQSPLYDATTKKQKFLDYLDIAMTILFSFEVVIRVISNGFYLNGPKSYLRESSNILDFFVVVISIIAIFITQGNLAFVKVIRIATRLTRPLRLVFRDEKLKISIKVIWSVLPQILRLLSIYFLFCLIFATIGVSLLSGRSYECKTIHTVGLSLQLKASTIQTANDCLNYGGDWVITNPNFDNVVSAFIQMFTMTQAVGWTNNLMRVMRSTGQETAPHEYPPFSSGLYLSFFIIIWMIVGYFFIQNLFVALVMASYNREIENHSSIILTEEQQKLVQTEFLTFRVQPLFVHKKPQNPIRRFAFRLLYGKLWSTKAQTLEVKVSPEEKQRRKAINSGRSEITEQFIRYVVLVNAIALFIKWPNMNPKIQLFADIVSYSCNAIFILEALLKIIAYGKNYFRSSWNKFEFAIVVGSLIFISPSQKKQRLVLTLLRCIVLLKVVTSSKGLQKQKIIYKTISATMLSLMNVGFLMILVIYIFAIIGVQFFATIKLNGPMTNLYNFQTVHKSFLTLYRVMTRDHWNELMEALSLQNSAAIPCIQSPTYEDFVASGFQTVGCGKPTIAVLYFFTYSFMISVVFLSLFIAIICAAYFAASDNNKDKKFKDMIERYRMIWSFFDPDGKGEIGDKDFENLIFALDQPLGLSSRHRFDKKLQLYVKRRIGAKMQKHQKSKRTIWYFDELLDNLLLFYLIYERVKKEMETAKIRMSEDGKLKRTSLQQENELHQSQTLQIQSPPLLVRSLKQNRLAKRAQSKSSLQVLTLRPIPTESKLESPRTPDNGHIQMNFVFHSEKQQKETSSYLK